MAYLHGGRTLALGALALLLCASSLTSSCKRQDDDDEEFLAQEVARKRRKSALRQRSEEAKGKAAAKRAAARGAKAAGAKGSANAAVGRLLPPEKAPHPDYPTPAKAKTDKIFLLEEPDRGPAVGAPALPSEKGLRFETHAHCADGVDRVVCGPASKLRGARRFFRVGKDRKGKVVLVEERFGPRVEGRYILAYDKGGALQRLTYLDRFGVAMWARSFDASGRRYYERKRSGANRLRGCGRMAVDRDKRGWVSRLTCLQWSGAPMNNALGVVYTRLTRDRRGLVIAERFEDDKGKLRPRHDEVAQITLRRDPAGRVVERKAFDAKQFPMLSMGDEGCHGWRYRFDARGLEVERRCLAVNGKEALDTGGRCRFTYSYDGRGCHVGTDSFKLDNDRRCTRAGERYRYGVDARCARLQKRCLAAGRDQRVRCGVREPAEYRYTLDARGDVISTKHFAVSGASGQDPHCRVFEERVRRDERGNILEKRYFGTSGQPLECSRTGFHGLRHTLDGAGRVLEKRFIAVDGGVGSNLGTALRKQRFDNYDHFVEARNFNSDDKPHAALGSAVQRRIYDEGHRIFGMLLYDAKGRPARYRGCYTGRSCPNEPWHALRVVREANGRVSRNLFFDKDGQLVRTMLCSRARCWK